MTKSRSVAGLAECIESGMSLKYLFFWGHRSSKSGEISKGCFSQWFESPFEIHGVRYPTAEHFMMSEKARLFDDQETLQQILVAPSPGSVKALGRNIRGFDENRWVESRFSIVVRGNQAKFSQNAALGRFLIGTGDRVLVEASPLDRIWGIGMAVDDPDALNPHEWKGQNLLGFALMEVRDSLRSRSDE